MTRIPSNIICSVNACVDILQTTPLLNSCFLFMLLFTRRGGPGMSAVTSGAECAREGNDVTHGCARSLSIASPLWRLAADRSADSDTGIHHQQWRPPFVTYFYSLTLFEEFQILKIVFYWIDWKNVLILRDVMVIIRHINIWNLPLKIIIPDRTDINVILWVGCSNIYDT